MKRINDLRSVWPHEANDFTKWLEISNWLFDKAKIFKSVASNIDK